MIPDNKWSAPWTTDDRCTRHQAAQAEIDVRNWFAGNPHAGFDALKSVFLPIADECRTFLEVGCGCGYNLEILKSLNPALEYVGLDISTSMVEFASQKYEGEQFVVGSADRMPFGQNAMDCVCLAAVIQHTPDWRVPILEARRVASEYIILHRVQATKGQTWEFINEAYETQLATRENNEDELLEFCFDKGLSLVHAHRWGNLDFAFNASYLLRTRTLESRDRYVPRRPSSTSGQQGGSAPGAESQVAGLSVGSSSGSNVHGLIP